METVRVESLTMLPLAGDRVRVEGPAAFTLPTLPSTVAVATKTATARLLVLIVLFITLGYHLFSIGFKDYMAVAAFILNHII